MNLAGYLDNTDAQDLSLSGNTLQISGGSNVDLSSFANSNAALIQDADNDTKVEVEENPDEDVIKMSIAGENRFSIKKGDNGATILQLNNNNDNTFLGSNAGKVANSTGIEKCIYWEKCGKS